MPANTGVGQLAGRRLRTALNLRKATARQKALLKGLGWRKHLLDVPVPPAKDMPLLIKTQEPAGHLAGRIFPGKQAIRAHAHEIPSWHSQSVIGVQRKRLAQDFPHENVHWAVWSVPTGRKSLFHQRLAKLAQDEKGIASRLRRHPLYAVKDDAAIGGEILARKEGYVSDPVLRAQQEKAWGRVNPKIFLDPRGLPINPEGTARKLYDWAYD